MTNADGDMDAFQLFLLPLCHLDRNFSFLTSSPPSVILPIAKSVSCMCGEVCLFLGRMVTWIRASYSFFPSVVSIIFLHPYFFSIFRYFGGDYKNCPYVYRDLRVISTNDDLDTC